MFNDAHMTLFGKRYKPYREIIPLVLDHAI